MKSLFSNYWKAPRFWASVFVLLSGIGPAMAGGGSRLIVEWEGGTIRFDHNRMFLYFGPTDVRARDDRTSTPKAPIVDCDFADTKTKCWKLSKPAKPEFYGPNLRFVKPIAVLPIPYGPEIDPESKEMPWDADLKTQDKEYVAGLKVFQPKALSDQELSKLTEQSDILGVDTDDQVYSRVNETEGGAAALEMWKGQIGKLPHKTCFDSMNYCSVVVNAKTKGHPAIAYCFIMNSSVGLGTPFNCSVVAYLNKGEWYIFSYNGPSRYEKGGAAGASCVFESKLSRDEIEQRFIDAMKKGRTNITLSEIEKSDERVSLAGKQIATPSKFYDGYYDKSYAVYSIREQTLGQPHRTITIEGLFNLLISVEPSDRGKDYREFGDGDKDTDLVWFQNQVLNIIKHGIAEKIGTKVDCQTQPIN